MIPRICVALCCMLLCCTMTAHAGNTGILRGRVASEDGVYRRAMVKVVSRSATGTTTTDKHGFFVFIDLPPDTYNIVASAAVDSQWRSACQFFAITVMSDQASEVRLALVFPMLRICSDRVKRLQPQSPQTAVTADLYDIF